MACRICRVCRRKVSHLCSFPSSHHRERSCRAMWRLFWPARHVARISVAQMAAHVTQCDTGGQCQAGTDYVIGQASEAQAVQRLPSAFLDVS